MGRGGGEEERIQKVLYSYFLRAHSVSGSVYALFLLIL